MIRVSKRASMPFAKAMCIRMFAVLISLAISAVLIYTLTKMNPLKVYDAMIHGAFGTSRRIWVTLRDIMMLLCISVGLAPAFKMRFWNIGAEGQILVGGIASAACMIYFGTVPTVLLLVIMLIASLSAGGVWGMIPAFFKAKWNTNETLFTLMLNYIAIKLTSYFVSLWENPPGSNNVGLINQASKAGWFPPIFGQEHMLNIMLVLVVTIIMYIYLSYSNHGYEIAVIGESKNTARYAAINVERVTIRTMTLSGAVCGMAGFLAVAGASHTISTTTAGGKGFVAIIIAWLAKFNPLVMIPISALLVFLERGAVEIASRYNISDYVSSMVTGIILFFILGSEFFINYKLNIVHKVNLDTEVKA